MGWIKNKIFSKKKKVGDVGDIQDREAELSSNAKKALIATIKRSKENSERIRKVNDDLDQVWAKLEKLTTSKLIETGKL